MFSDGNDTNVIKAAIRLAHDGICVPVLLGNPEKIHSFAKAMKTDLAGIEIIDVRSDKCADTRKRYAGLLAEMKGREGT